MLEDGQAESLAKVGLDHYNHNFDVPRPLPSGRQIN